MILRLAALTVVLTLAAGGRYLIACLTQPTVPCRSCAGWIGLGCRRCHGTGQRTRWAVRVQRAARQRLTRHHIRKETRRA